MLGYSLGASDFSNIVQALEVLMTTRLLETLQSMSLLRSLKAPLSTAQSGTGWLCCAILCYVNQKAMRRNAVLCCAVLRCILLVLMQCSAMQH